MIVRGYSAGIEENINRPGDCFDKSLRVCLEIEMARRKGFEKLVFVGSSCMYPLDAPQPYKESSLGLGGIEETSAAHAYANLAAYAQCKAYSKQYRVNYFTAIQADVYGEPGSTHFVEQIMRRMHYAKESGAKDIVIWGDGTAVREPMHVDDAERAITFVHKHYVGPAPINLGTGIPYSIAAVARTIKEVVGFSGELVFDCAKSSGAPRKTLDSSKLFAMDFRNSLSLHEGLAKTYYDLKYHLR